MTMIRVTDIKWDTAGEDMSDVADIALPGTIELVLPDDLSCPEEIEEYISDEISNITGFCHQGFQYQDAEPACAPEM